MNITTIKTGRGPGLTAEKLTDGVGLPMGVKIVGQVIRLDLSIENWTWSQEERRV